jgi:hypothetical protein
VRARLWAACVGALALGLGCSTNPVGARSITTEIRLYLCAPGCPVPPADPSATITDVNRGDSVLVFMEVSNGFPFDPGLPDSSFVIVRGRCAENAALLDGAGLRRTVPSTVSCPDSVVRRYVERAGGNTELRYLPWLVDSGLVAGTYVLQGRLLVDPVLLPELQITVH